MNLDLTHKHVVIQTKRLILRQFKPTDWRDLYEYLSDPEVVEFEPYEVFSEDDCINEAIRRSSDFSFWAVCTKENRKLIGNLYFDRRELGTFFIGFVFNTRYHSQGYAFESSRALISYGIEHLGVRQVVAMCNGENKASWRLLEKLGLKRVGHFVKQRSGSSTWINTFKYESLTLK